MRSPANRRRSTRNRQQPPAAANESSLINYVPKLKYAQSKFNDEGIFLLSKRKRSPPTEEAKEAKRQKQAAIKKRKFFVLSLRHKVINLWLHGSNCNEWVFGQYCAPKITAFLQHAYPDKYGAKAAARSFVYRTIERFREADAEPEYDPFRDLRGVYKPQFKRKNARIVELTDELLSERNASGPKVQRGLRRNGFRVSLSTIYRIAKDLMFGWTKPWHTDILTPAQKLKRKLFCGKLLRLGEEALLQLISRWLFTDEKWWDIVGPAPSKWRKGATEMERKLQNQVRQFARYFARYLARSLSPSTHDRRSLGTNRKKEASKKESTSGRASRGIVKLPASRGRRPTTKLCIATHKTCVSAPSSRTWMTRRERRLSFVWSRRGLAATIHTCGMYHTSTSPTRTRHARVVSGSTPVMVRSKNGTTPPARRSPNTHNCSPRRQCKTPPRH